MDDFEKHINKKLQNPSFAKKRKESEAEHALVKALVEARNEAGMTQQQLSKKSEIDQAVLSRIESGKANPSIKTLLKVANGLGKKLIIDFR
ncbi:MAG: helix-turn-helix domain-containing protein [Saccharofermentanales bacterium]